VTVHNDVVALPSGNQGRYLRIVENDGKPGVAALAMASGKIALVHVYRYPTQAWEWAIPRGFGHTDDPVESIKQELLEEVGGIPERIERLVRVASNSGLLAGHVEIYVAHYSVIPGGPLDVDEISDIRWETPAQLQKEILSGDIVDAFTIAAYGTALAKNLF
jgi:8-oxo-dGTP pyrophosphatase MutT (NUDIX family)